MEGDTLYMIAKRNGISLEALIDANKNLDFYNLEVGMTLCIPGVSDGMNAPCHHPDLNREGCYYVRMNDNLDTICNKFRVLPRNLMKTNPDLSIVDYSIPGTRICIPGN